MPAISFSTLKDKILSGEKKQTIRPMNTNYWLRFRKGDRLVGYWKMRTKECEKMFESTFCVNPFMLRWKDFNNHLMVLDGFKDLESANEEWFLPHYGDRFGWWADKKFVVIRWL